MSGAVELTIQCVYHLRRRAEPTSCGTRARSDSEMPVEFTIVRLWRMDGCRWVRGAGSRARWGVKHVQRERVE